MLKEKPFAHQISTECFKQAHLVFSFAALKAVTLRLVFCASEATMADCGRIHQTV